ncbi:MAG: glycosyltransferase family 2 protein [Nitrospirae bacterium]|nr:glycosyltransferase family 2 protein [Nitrospirota bacterium]MBF0533810.1 glycosyltransferase family 2 protein [Nitrospirota bacterium]MBF0615481.1 glycosyltransferase family 2 protein [Nitrospirota bacterium]
MRNVHAHKVAVVIPAYKVSHYICEVLTTIPAEVSEIIVVDDCCPENSGKAAESAADTRVSVLYNAKNMGVGGAVIEGYKKALQLNCTVIVKMDGDGQMNPAYLKDLIAPIIEDSADYSKGNRFFNFKALKAMPFIRLFGNSALSFAVKLTSGYWNLADPTNGYTAISSETLKKLDLEKISVGYFFESSMLINLNIINAVVADVNIPAKYGDERSSLSIAKVLLSFPSKLMSGFLKRILFKYFIYDFNMASVYMLLGIPMFLFGVSLGLYEWVQSSLTGLIRSPGTIMLTALPIIVSFQMLLQAINIDISSVPKRRC